MMRTVLWTMWLSMIFVLGPQLHSEDTKSKPEFLMQSVSSVLKWFTSVEKYYEEHQILPAARHQSIEKLKVLSDQLSKLATRKESFALELRFVKTDEDLDKLQETLDGLEKTVGEFRQSLHEYAAILPPNLQADSDELENQLSAGLMYKAAGLRYIALHLNGSKKFNRNEVLANGYETVKTVKALKGKVDELIAKLANQQ